MTDVAAFLSPYPDEIQALANQLRVLIKETLADLDERVYPGWQLIGYRQGTGKNSRYFAFLAPFDDHLKLGFEWGILIRDEANWLEGDGKQVRYFTLKPGEALEGLPLAGYLQGAVEVAHLTREQKTARLMEMEEEREAKGQTWNQSATK